ncbi:MAG TPA: hydrogenase maturation nickel metallochaperone HypA [Anaerolineaceae bacterium]|nr:hydrogenase maturation nickel metallochaperone HypA [Anaerolineaceae bacterium]HQH84282.1 hydrogenase maturation nickel metallochaperone HypA [Anaerolineaceae bacterium]HQN45227.1 hydrogenase maturation nickel metallochaperone HypA [Anaerolineaceae bacterium]
MHELSVTESILNIASRHAEQAEAKRVTDIHIVVGKLSSIVDDSVQFYWDMISEGTICAGATLHFQRVPARLACLDCNAEFELSAELIPCPKCGSVRVKVLAGEEFWLDSIEITR